MERDEDNYFLFQLKDGETGQVIRYFTDEGHEGEEWDHYSEIEDPETQNAFWNQHIVDEVAYAVDTAKKMLATDPDADFILHTGDIVEIAEVEDEWVDLFDVPSEGPIDGGSYYSFDYNGVHFVNVNTNDYKNEENKAIGDDQLEWLTEELLEEYNNLFAFGGQPDNSPRCEVSHSNFRNSKVQNFARYMIDGNTLKVELYQISGELTEERVPELVDSFTIVKGE